MIPEQKKIPGVCYAWTPETGEPPGLELPVIDLTHPAFAFPTDDQTVNALIDSLTASAERLAVTPPAVLAGILEKSLLMRGMVRDSAGTYTTGLMTYLNKLTPAALGDGYATPLDRQWAASLTPLTFRWRMRDLARLLADGLAPLLAARPGAPLVLVNIAGGPAADSLNALIFLQKEHPGLLDGRRITVIVLDLDSCGPAFGANCLAALIAEGGPLHGLAAGWAYTPYNWSNPAVLRRALLQIPEGAVAAGSSEGGLFEYAGDEEIAANLVALRETTPPDFFLCGPVIRGADALDVRLQATERTPGRPAVRYIGLDRFAALAAPAGWTIQQHLDGPMHQVVKLVKS